MIVNRYSRFLHLEADFQNIYLFQPWASGMPGGGASGAQAGWGHMSPQQMRNPWQDPNALGKYAYLLCLLQ